MIDVVMRSMSGGFGRIAEELRPKNTNDDDPAPEMRLGIIIAAIFFLGFLGWAALAPLDAAARASGRVTVAGHRQVVQHKEGGVVGALFVREGQRVQKDQVLIQLAAADTQAAERALAAQVIGFQAQRARLLAEQVGAPIMWPVEFQSLTGPDLEEARRAMALQESQYGARSQTRNTQTGVLGQRSAQLQEQISGYQKQIQSIDLQKRLLNDELAGMRELNSRGFAPLTQVRALERTVAQLDGQRAQLVASIAQTRERIGETRLLDVEAGQTRQEQIAAELREVDGHLSDALPRWRAAQDQLARTQVRAPATGAVVGLTVYTVGSVISPGQKLMDVVPEKAPMVLEARFAPQDADDLNIGQSTTVRFPGLHERDLPNLSGVLSRVSADSFTDEKTGREYFLAEVTVPVAEVDKIKKVRGGGFELRPGMPAELLVPLRKRTALQYLFEPLSQAVWSSFREH